MKNILIPKDYEYLVGLAAKLREESAQLTKKLGEYAAHGGAVPFQIPEYQATDDRLRTIKERFRQVNKAIKTHDVVTLKEIDDRLIGPYCLVETEDEDTHKKESYYIVHSEIIDRLNIKDKVFPVSPKSPVGQALIDHEVGDIAEARLPNRVKVLKIINFKKKEY